MRLLEEAQEIIGVTGSVFDTPPRHELNLKVV